MFRAAVIASIVLAAAVSGCEPPDCDRKDCGTCGNACCRVEYTFAGTAEDLKDSLLKALSNGGPDGGYSLSAMAEGSIGFADLRPYKVGVDFIGQAIHTTAVKHYNDTINWTVRQVNGTAGSVEAIVEGFSTSQIGGAFCDAGQNYKNHVQVVKALGRKYTEKTIFGCPASSVAA